MCRGADKQDSDVSHWTMQNGELMRIIAVVTGFMCAMAVTGNSGAGDLPTNPERWFAFRSFRPDSETMEQFGAAGVKVHCIFPANTLCSLAVPYSSYPPVWLGPDRYDFECLDRQIAQVLDANPSARIICMIDLNTPDWWVRAHGRKSGCVDSFYELGRVLATDRWRKDTRTFLETFLRHTEAAHGDAVIAYVLAGGCTTEWQDCSWGEESASRRAAWQQWMKDRGKADPVDIPPASVREYLSHELFRDPVEDGLAVDYWKFCHWLNAETIEYFARAAHEVTQHRVPVGVYYGYVMEHARNRLLYEGHLEYDRLFRSDALDFFIAPASYSGRPMGGGSGFMQCLASIRHHGKGYVLEIDHRTPTANAKVAEGVILPGYESGWPDAASTIAGLRREFCLALTSGVSLWWFDMFGGWYAGEGVMEAITQMRSLWERLATPGQAPAAETALIVDAESLYYLDGRSAFASELLSAQRDGLGRMGAPYDILSFADVGDMDLSGYKLVLLPGLFVVDDVKKKMLEEKVFRDARTVVWVRAPGIITNGRYDPVHVEALSGIPAGVTELTSRDMGTWTSVLSPGANLSASTLRTLAGGAGVHLYIDTEEPVYATENLLAVHTGTGGLRTIHLRQPCGRVTELFSGRVIAGNATEFTDTLQAPETVLYELTP